MERERVGGRFVKEGDALNPNRESDGEPNAKPSTKRPAVVRSRSARLLRKARRSLVAGVPEVADKLVKDAKTGSVQHVKLLLQVLGLEKGGMKPRTSGPREKTLEEIIMECWEKEP